MPANISVWPDIFGVGGADPSGRVDLGAIEMNAGSTPPPSPAPSIASFTATPSTLTGSGTTTFAWSSSNTTGCSISPGSYIGLPATGTRTSSTITVTTTFKLTCTGSGGSATRNVSVTVNPPPDTTPPTVSLTAPTPGATLFGTTTLTATASDASGIAKVEFYRGTTLIGTDTTSPYSVSWNTTTVANATYSLSAKATDNSSNANPATTSPITITVNNAPPSPAITSFTATPMTVTSGSTTRLDWTTTNATSCSINPGGYTSLSNNGSLTTAPLTANTSFTLTCAGGSGTFPDAETVNVTVQGLPDTEAPSVSLNATTKPIAGAAYRLIATATDNSKVITKVEFFLGSTKLSEDTTAPYEHSWSLSGLPNGNYSVTAKAYDPSGNMGSVTATFKIRKADVTGDGQVSEADISALTTNWGSTNPDITKTYDLNGNDTVDIGDVAILVSWWGR